MTDKHEKRSKEMYKFFRDRMDDVLPVMDPMDEKTMDTAYFRIEKIGGWHYYIIAKTREPGVYWALVDGVFLEQGSVWLSDICRGSFPMYFKLSAGEPLEKIYKEVRADRARRPRLKEKQKFCIERIKAENKKLWDGDYGPRDQAAMDKVSASIMQAAHEAEAKYKGR